MEKIKEFFNKPLYVGIIGLVVGMVIGLVVLGWGLWPVQWENAGPGHMREDYQRDYLCMAIDSFTRNPDPDLLAIRWKGLGENAGEVLDSLTPAVCGFTSADDINAFKDVVSLQAFANLVSADQPAAVPEGEAVEEVIPEVESVMGMEESVPADASTISILPLMILILLTLVVGGILVFIMLKKAKGGAGLKIKAPKIVLPKRKVVEEASLKGDMAEKAVQKDTPLAQFMTTYRQGDDLYDDSFSIDSMNGEFLGECGVGIAETIGVGDPKKVTALEVWLFDKNDIQTVTKVLMSEHANNDPALRQRLLSKGEPILVEPGMKFVMETETLQLEARVIDMVYARGPLPENSYFSRLTLEISVWPK